MPFGSIQLVPGVDLIGTPTAGQGEINEGNLLRWKLGIPERLGGWVRYYPTSLGSTPRDLHPWQDLNTTDHLGVGCTESLNVITDGVLADITPQTTTTNTLPDFTTTTASATVTVIDNNVSNPSVGSFVQIVTPVSVDGILLAGVYPISTVISGTSYTIEAADAATAIATSTGNVAAYYTTSGSASIRVTLPNNGLADGDIYYSSVNTTASGIVISGSYAVSNTTGSAFEIQGNILAGATATTAQNSGLVQFKYYVTIGPQEDAAGYGTGTYGTGGYGIGIAPPAGQGTPITAVDWSLDNWGEILLANPEGGPIFMWQPQSGNQNASLVDTAPISNTSIFVTMPQQILVALGASPDGAPQPLRVAWSDAGNFTDFVATSANFAGSYNIPRGSRLVGGLQAATQNLLWTDLGVWSMQYVNRPLIFGFNEIMSGCGLIGSHAAVLAEGTVFWMSQNQFFYMTGGGGPRQLPCSVWDAVFQNLNQANVYKIRAGANSAFNEIWWHYPSANATENDSYVKFNLVENEWDYGALPTGRSAWVDQSILGTPIGADPTGVIFQHEQGYDGDGQALSPFFQTGYWVIGEGEDFAFVDQVLPDFTYGTYSGSANAVPMLTFYSVDYPNGPVTTYGPYSVGNSVTKIATRIRGRQMAMRCESQGAGVFWRLGKIRFRWAPAGRR